MRVDCTASTRTRLAAAAAATFVDVFLDCIERCERAVGLAAGEAFVGTAAARGHQQQRADQARGSRAREESWFAQRSGHPHRVSVDADFQAVSGRCAWFRLRR